MIIFFKYAIAVMFVGLLLVLVKSVSSAFIANINIDQYESVRESHKRWVGIAFWLMVIAVITTELMVKFNGGIQNKDFLYVHFAFAFPFAFVLASLHIWHKRLDKRKLIVIPSRTSISICFALYIGTMITGYILWRGI
jgi:uncharacterized membrane protein